VRQTVSPPTRRTFATTASVPTVMSKISPVAGIALLFSSKKHRQVKRNASKVVFLGSIVINSDLTKYQQRRPKAPLATRDLGV